MPATTSENERPQKPARANNGGSVDGPSVSFLTADAALRSMNRVAEAWGISGDGEQAQEAVHRSTRNVDSMAQCTTALAHGAQEFSRAWSDCAQTSIRHGLEGMDRLRGCRTVMEVGAAQTDIMRQALQDMVATNIALSESYAKIARAGAERCCPESSGTAG